MTAQYVSYLRVSTTKQVISGLGIEAQRQATGDFVRLHGGNLIGEYVEAESGAADDRVQLAAALGVCRERRASLLVAKLDRLARSVSFVSAVMDSDVPIVAADNPHASRLVLHMLAAVAEFEREQISARTKAALAVAKARGVKLGANGATLAAKHAMDAKHWARQVAEPFTRAVMQSDSLVGAAIRLNSEGTKTRNGGEWSATQVKRVASRLSLSLPWRT